MYKMQAVYIHNSELSAFKPVQSSQNPPWLRRSQGKASPLEYPPTEYLVVSPPLVSLTLHHR